MAHNLTQLSRWRAKCGCLKRSSRMQGLSSWLAGIVKSCPIEPRQPHRAQVIAFCKRLASVAPHELCSSCLDYATGRRGWCPAAYYWLLTLHYLMLSCKVMHTELACQLRPRTASPVYMAFCQRNWLSRLSLLSCATLARSIHNFSCLTFSLNIPY